MADGAAPEIDSLYRCSVCSRPYVPRGRLQTRTCGDARCRTVYSARAEVADPERAAKKRAREQRRTVEHSAYYTARSSLRARGLLTPEALAALEALRGQGRVPLREALDRVGLGHLWVPPTYARRPLAPRSEPEPTTGDVWALPSPDHTAPLALAVELRLSQQGIPRQRVRDYGGARLLHGALHRAANVGHSRAAPAWSLVLPSERSARLWLVAYRAEILERLPRSVLLGCDAAPHDVALGLRSMLRAPRPRAPGSYRVRVWCETPLVLRKGISGAQRRAGALDPHELQDAPQTLTGSLLQVAHRVGLSPLRETELVAQIVARDLERVCDDDGEDGVRVGSHWRIGQERGRIAALVGWVDVECNAPARWLLDCAALVGLGAKTTLGFGRVRVEDR